MREIRERDALVAILLAGLLLRVLLIYPFGHLLGEDTYFHRDLIRFLIDGGGLAQYNILEWETSHPYFLALSAKLAAYPFGFHMIVYPFAKVFGESAFKYFPVALSSLTPLFVYLFMKEFTGRGDVSLMAAVLYTVPDVIAHSILLLPQGIGILFLPLTLWLYLRTEYGGVAGALMFFVHPFSGVAIMLSMFALGIWRREWRKVIKIFLISAVVVATYSIMTLLNSDPGSSFSMRVPDLVIYGARRYVSAFTVALLFPIGLLFMRKRYEWYLVAGAAVFGIASVFQMSNLPPERAFVFLAFFLSCISAYAIAGIRPKGLKALFSGIVIVISLFACTDIFGNIGPSYVEVSSWAFINDETIDDTMVWGWERYPQIYSMERRTVYAGDYPGVEYICPDAHLLGSSLIGKYLLSDRVNVIYDNYIPILTVND
ncbi:MAG: hypothetical protein JW825_02010 [Candidatus Methanofastidiosa archaeon]|nr:hypothetical protein [Candidatus Methanofastidiosa archaeon]